MNDAVFREAGLADYPRFYQLAYGFSQPQGQGILKARPADFIVEEILGFELSGEGEHLWVFIEAIDMNTEFLLKQLAKCLAIEKRNISYSGKKDRLAITRQWFSLHLPGQEIELPQNIHPNVTVLKSHRHHKKLRRGTHQANQFHIRVTQAQFNHQEIKERLNGIATQGFPNYFGPQRFGNQEANLESACRAILNGKRLKRVERDRVFSTLRAWDFNRLLSFRVATQHWREYLNGDALQLAGTQSLFTPSEWSDELQQRLRSGDIQVAGLLPGAGPRIVPLADGSTYQTAPTLQTYLEKQRVEQGTRPLAVRPEELDWQLLDNEIQLRFRLPKGAYATSLLREVIQLQDANPETSELKSAVKVAPEKPV